MLGVPLIDSVLFVEANVPQGLNVLPTMKHRHVWWKSALVWLFHGRKIGKGLGLNRGKHSKGEL